MRAIGNVDKEAPVQIDPHHRGQLTLETHLKYLASRTILEARDRELCWPLSFVFSSHCAPPFGHHSPVCLGLTTAHWLLRSALTCNSCIAAYSTLDFSPYDKPSALQGISCKRARPSALRTSLTHLRQTRPTSQKMILLTKTILHKPRLEPLRRILIP
ncbi:hypothetical protein BU16DRAFT_388281 [Lophium mytilinum]|uniref:Uncharacterized protein n=1 Tax=Lophium mytilinum TaxID=390894 RepID=A0A6A6QUG7_9PEZI|nr:hypothetical protein BU16DRAFT_388281 [Lophium mytilinum]